jgi:outer membrane protein insertion porin family
MLRIVRRVVSCLVFILPLAAQAAATTETIKTISVEGAQRIEPSAVAIYFGLEAGKQVTQYDLDLGVKKIYGTGFYSDVSLDDDNGAIIIHVKENPTINQVIFEGNDKISKDDLEKEITLKARSIYTRAKVQNDLKRLLDVYRRNGRYSAEINPQIISLEQNRVNLVYNITEGPKAYIEKITFIGNENYDSRTLSKVINSSVEHWYQFLSDNDKYDPDRLSYDQELLRKFYFQNGYADFKIKSAIAELSPQQDAFYLTFTIEEGERYHFGKIDVQSKLPAGKLPDLTESISVHPGDIYNATEVEDSINRMTDLLGDHGFAFVEINPDVKRHPNGEKIIDLTFTIEEGPKVYVDRINIFGNLRTLDEVIRREFKLSEGDAFSTSKLKRTEQRLNNLGYFEKVNIERSPGSTPDKTDLNVEVTEKSTGEISLGAGYSTVDGPLADIGSRERNFLGGGQDVHARATIGARRKNYDFGVTEPYFLGRELEAGFDIYKTIQNYQDNATFDRDSEGITLKLGYNLSEYLKHQLTYTIEQSKITNVDPLASRFIKDQEGVDTASIVGHSLTYDKRDNKQSPTSGYVVRVSQDFAGIGGDDVFLRHELKGDYYLPIAKQWTYFLSGAAGNIHGIGQDVRINQRFFIGSEEIRGFANAGIGPRDSTTGDPLGGDTYYAVTNEVRFPLGLPDDLGVSGALFVDAGSLWGLSPTDPTVSDNSSMRVGAGAGVAWASPFGPIRIDFALPVVKQRYDDTQLIRFKFGTNF